MGGGADADAQRLLKLVDDETPGERSRWTTRSSTPSRASWRRRRAGADDAFIARCLAIPSEGELSELVSPADPDVIHAAREFVVKTLAAELGPLLEEVLKAKSAEAYRATARRAAERTLRTRASIS